jgi:ATP-dependent Clp protease ATP-binding subunit ClpB
MQASKERLEEVRHELKELEDKLKPLLMRYQQEKQALDELRALQRKRDELKVKLTEAENRMDLAMVADIK